MALKFNPTTGQLDIAGGGTTITNSADNVIARFDGTNALQGGTNAPYYDDSGNVIVPASISKPDATHTNSENFGAGNTVGGNDGIVVGNNAAVGTQSVAIGRTVVGNQTRVICISPSGGALGQWAVAIGFAAVSNQRAVSIGYFASSNAVSAISIGYQCKANFQSAISIGQSAQVLIPLGTAIGSAALITANGTNGAIAIGPTSSIDAEGGIAIGNNAKVLSGGGNAVTIGRLAQSAAPNSFAFGAFSSIASGHTESAAFGYFAVTSEAGEFVFGRTETRQYTRQFGGEVMPIDTVSTNTTLNRTRWTVLVDTSSGDITITLPAAATYAGQVYNIKKKTSDPNKVIIDGNVSETIDGSLTAEITVQYESITIQCDGTEWFIL